MHQVLCEMKSMVLPFHQKIFGVKLLSIIPWNSFSKFDSLIISIDWKTKSLIKVKEIVLL